MKTLILFPITLCLLGVGVLSFIQEPTIITLQDAIKKKLITVTIQSNGAYSGNSVDFNATNTTNQSLKISIPAGTVFIPKAEEDQNLIVPEEEVLALAPKGKVKKIVNGFCIEASNHAPTSAASMTISSSSNPKMVKLISFIKGKKFDGSTIQDALWAVSDNNSVNNIENESENGKALRKFICELTGQKQDWYHSAQNRTVSVTREIQSAPVKVTGKVDFVSNGTTKMALSIYRANGELIHRFEDKSYPKKGKVESEFSLKVEGWEKGNYEVRILSGETIVKKFPFVL